MSNSFGKKFENFIDEVASNLNLVGEKDQPSSRFHKAAPSPGTIVAGDALFFKYRSNKFGEGDHMVMVIGNNRNPNGIYTYRSKNGTAKKYLSAVKLNKIWSFTASLIIEAYRDKQVRYTSEREDSEDPQKFQEEDVEDNQEPEMNTSEDIKKVDESKDRKTKKSFMSLVGRNNYRSYILNNMWNTYEFGNKKEDTE